MEDGREGSDGEDQTSGPRCALNTPINGALGGVRQRARSHHESELEGAAHRLAGHMVTVRPADRNHVRPVLPSYL